MAFNLHKVTLCKLGLSAILSVLVATAAQAQAGDTWRKQVTLYGWGARIGGDFTPFTGGPVLSFDKSLSEVLEDLDAVFLVTGLAINGDFVVFGGLSYSAASKSGLVAGAIPASGEVKQAALTLTAGRRIVDGGTTTVDALAGARIWLLDGEVNVPAAAVSLAPEKRFVDPIIAARVNHRIADRWTVLGYVDLGGFGVGSDLTYQLAMTANYQMTDSLYVSGGYRHLYVDYSEDGTAFDGAMSGPVVGLSWRF